MQTIKPENFPILAKHICCYRRDIVFYEKADFVLQNFEPRVEQHSIGVVLWLSNAVRVAGKTFIKSLHPLLVSLDQQRNVRVTRLDPVNTFLIAAVILKYIRDEN